MPVDKIISALVMITGGIWRGAAFPQWFGIFVVSHLLENPGRQSLFSTCPPNNFLPDTPW